MNTFMSIRKRLKLTQAEIAVPLEVSQGNVSLYERGQTIPPAVAAKLIAFAKRKGVKLTFDDIYAASSAGKKGTPKVPAMEREG